MALVKKSEASAKATDDSGTAAAIERLQATAPMKIDAHPNAKAWKPRDFDAEARGKTRCVQFQYALPIPAMIGLRWTNTEEYLEHVKKIADYGVKYTFDEL